MNAFDRDFVPEQKEEFGKWFEHYVRGKLRENIYVHVLQNVNNNQRYFDLGEFNDKYVCDMKLTKKITTAIMEELRELGWKVATSYGHTGLFVYDGEKPINLWPDEDSLI